LRVLLDQSRQKGLLSEETNDSILREIQIAEKKNAEPKIPENERQWIQNMTRDLEIRKEIFDEVIRKITIIINMITLRFISREMVQREKSFYSEYENRVQAINAYLYAQMCQEVNEYVENPATKTGQPIKEFLIRKCAHCIRFMNCIRQIDLAISLCAQREIQAPERLRTPEVGTDTKMRSPDVFFDELQAL
jgi:hypothetical protein